VDRARPRGGTGADRLSGALGKDRVVGGKGADAIKVATAGPAARVRCGKGKTRPASTGASGAA
jgi:hypothetical protein